MTSPAPRSCPPAFWPAFAARFPRIPVRVLTAAAAVALALYAVPPLLPEALAQGTRAQPTTPTLRVGSAAPKLSIGQWVKGEPVQELQRGKVYVVEFWATWCGPCRRSIPHLTQVQNRHRAEGLTVIGVSIDQNTGAVKPFVDQQGATMDYTIGIDTRRSMARDWMQAAGVSGIPHAFVVGKDGLIAWAGNPLNTEAFDRAVERALSQPHASNVPGERPGETPPATPGGPTDDPSTLNSVREAASAGEWDRALTTLEAGFRARKLTRRTYRQERLDMLLTGTRDTAEAYRVARDYIREDISLNAEALRALALRILDDPAVPQRDYDVALLAANRASSLARDQDAAALALVARVHAARGDYDQAVRTQERAVARAAEGERAAMERTLDDYRLHRSRPKPSNAP
jgi:thiol-disulfide isomerase/thioredoxin